MDQQKVQSRYQTALEAFTTRLKTDSQVIAAILAGSMSYDVVWEKSDIDMIVVVKEQQLPKSWICLEEDGVLFNVELTTFTYSTSRPRACISPTSRIYWTA